MAVKQSYLDIKPHLITYKIDSNLLLKRKFYIKSQSLRKYRKYFEMLGSIIMEEYSDKFIAITDESDDHLPNSVT